MLPRRSITAGRCYLSTFLREEGRLATLTGDRAGAIRAYQYYLVLRADLEPALRPQVGQVQTQLAQLQDERGNKTKQPRKWNTTGILREKKQVLSTNRPTTLHWVSGGR